MTYIHFKISLQNAIAAKFLMLFTQSFRISNQKMPCKSGSGKEGSCCCSKVAEDRAQQQYPKKKLLTWAVETFYDNCAAYNLRYVPYRTSYDRSTCLHNAVKDIVMLLCFMAANFVVLLTILTKLAIHLGGVFLDTVDWLLHKSHDQKCQIQKRLKALISSEAQVPQEKLTCCPRVVE